MCTIGLLRGCMAVLMPTERPAKPAQERSDGIKLPGRFGTFRPRTNQQRPMKVCVRSCRQFPPVECFLPLKSAEIPAGVRCFVSCLLRSFRFLPASKRTAPPAPTPASRTRTSPAHPPGGPSLTQPQYGTFSAKNGQK